MAALLLSILYFYKKKPDPQSIYKIKKEKLVQEQELNDERLRFYTNITYEPHTSLTLIIGPLEDLQHEA
ncbi:hypothetical protein [Proteiniphilum sp. UBA1028]|uniref:hypothetical protein n=1 Tax=Proteiniphilum sp. UBA1028 TaxID=1947251 RepID=UPI000E8C4A98|nr:hypothetical protein [Proteiniphilum sp. UBA1028]HBG58851.1 hypothetical protein [Porphyromonadaceae bacterium]